MGRQRNLVPNVEKILDKYEASRSCDKKLLLLYWKIHDGVEMQGKSMNTQDFVDKATPPASIIRARRMVTELRPELNGNSHSVHYRQNKEDRMCDATRRKEVV